MEITLTATWKDHGDLRRESYGFTDLAAAERFANYVRTFLGGTATLEALREDTCPDCGQVNITDEIDDEIVVHCDCDPLAEDLWMERDIR